MKTQLKIRTGVAINEAIAICLEWATKLGQLRNKLIQKLVSESGQGVSARLIEQAVSEAEELARATMYPLLMLPVLAEEKVQTARQRVERRRWRQSQNFALMGN